MSAAGATVIAQARMVSGSTVCRKKTIKQSPVTSHGFLKLHEQHNLP
jgi:hypothetical protein